MRDIKARKDDTILITALPNASRVATDFHVFNQQMESQLSASESFFVFR